jgi:hypothetical protein
MTPLLLRVLRDPAAVRTLDLPGWDLLVRQARSANLLASLDALLDEHGLLDAAPAGPVRHLGWARAVARKHREAVHWEVAQIGAALAHVRRAAGAAQGRGLCDGRFARRARPPVLRYRHPGAESQPGRAWKRR